MNLRHRQKKLMVHFLICSNFTNLNRVFQHIFFFLITVYFFHVLLITVSMELVELNEVKNTIDEVFDNVTLLDVTSNEDILVSNDVPVLSTNTCFIMENVESSGISQEHESSGVETEQLTNAVEHKFELFSDDVMADEIIERYHHLFFHNDNYNIGIS